MDQKQIKTILILTAMQAEADPIIAALGLMPIETGHSDLFPTYQRKDQQGTCILITNGTCARAKVDRVGTQAAALTTWEGIRLYQPDLIINAGTAGGFHCHGAGVNDVYISDGSINYHDRRIPLPGFQTYAKGEFACYPVDQLALACQLKKGVMTTSNSLDMNDDDAELIEQSGAIVKDMEAAAIAEVAWLRQTPMIAIKAITDLMDSAAKTEDEFLQNLAKATATLANRVSAVVNFCFATSLQGLSAK